MIFPSALNRAFAVLLLAAAGFAGCSSDRNADKAAAEIVFKHSRIVGDPKIFANILAEFERRNPGLRVRDDEIPASTNEQHQFFVINLEGESAAFDVLSIDIIWIAEFARAGWILPVTHLYPADPSALFFPAALEAARYQNDIYAVPWYLDAGLLYYRKDLLDKHQLSPPKTWQDLVNAARTVQQAEGMHGFIWEAKQREGLVCTALEYLRGPGGDIFDGKRLVLNSPQNVRSLNFMRGLIAHEKISPPLITTLTEESARQLFAAGRAVFMRNWPYAWSLFQREGSTLRGKVGVGPLPTADGRPTPSTLGGWFLAVNRYSKNRAGAEALIRYLTSPEVQRELVRKVGYQPPLRELYADPLLLAEQPILAELAAVFAAARPRPATPYYLQISEILQPELSAVVAGVSSPEEALRGAEKRIRFILPPEERQP